MGAESQIFRPSSIILASLAILLSVFLSFSLLKRAPDPDKDAFLDHPISTVPNLRDRAPSNMKTCCIATISSSEQFREAYLFGHSLKRYTPWIRSELIINGSTHFRNSSVLQKLFGRISNSSYQFFVEESLWRIKGCGKVVFLSLPGVFNSDISPLCELHAFASVPIVGSQGFFDKRTMILESGVVPHFSNTTANFSIAANEYFQKWNPIEPMLSVGDRKAPVLDFISKFVKPSYISFDQAYFEAVLVNNSYEQSSEALFPLVRSAIGDARHDHPEIL